MKVDQKVLKRNTDGKIETYKILDFDVVSLYPSFSNAKLWSPRKSRKQKIEELLKNKEI